MKKNNGDQVNEVLNSLILSLEIISIDNDGFAKARILDPKFSQNIIKIPYNNQNIKFDENDHVLGQLSFFNDRIQVIKIIKKLEIERKFFYAQVKLNFQKELILQELERGKKSREIILPIVPK
ncbi:hypothetical protein OAC11_06765, partial [Alphaproteobacteria bacterium]|nr:hypothetical protein [Alphaproteobacteria bacterium]